MFYISIFVNWNYTHLDLIFFKGKMKYFNRSCVHDKVIVALNADNDKYLKYGTGNNGDLV